MKLFLLFLVGLLLVHVGLHGDLGSLLGAIIAPDYMIDTTGTGGIPPTPPQ